jgi:hypothetical protein
MFTGLLSACSSGLTMHIILKSPQKVTTAHHRIMVCTSAFYIITSLFVAQGAFL